MKNQVDIAIIGGGAGGLSAGIWGGQLNPKNTAPPKIVIFDGAKHLGAKILVAGGGRCNVTHEKVIVSDFQGEPSFIKKVLRALPVKQTVQWFEQMGVKLKTEPTGKRFPVSDRSRTVLDGLISQCQRVGTEIRCNHRVKKMERKDHGFEILFQGQIPPVWAKRVVMCTGGKSLAKTGSDGWGWEMVKALGHRVGQTWPGLVPLNLESKMFHANLSGLSMEVRLEVWVKGQRIDQRQGSLLWTHFGISGPVAMDSSRFWVGAKKEGATMKMAAWAACDFQMAQSRLLDQARENPSGSVSKFLAKKLPKRFVASLLDYLGIDQEIPLGQLRKEDRRTLVHGLTALDLEVVSDRGWNYAEVTAGGIDLSQVNAKSMQSKLVEGLYFCGEILDCEGRIGGFNFQWAWASGYLAGRSAVASLE